MKEPETQGAQDSQPKESSEAIRHRARGHQHDAERSQKPDRQHERVVAGIGAEPIPERIAFLIDDRRARVVETRGKERVSGHEIRVRHHQQDGAGDGARISSCPSEVLEYGPSEKGEREEHDLERTEEEREPESQSGQGPEAEASPLLRD
jgi:hypothetical protein